MRRKGRVFLSKTDGIRETFLTIARDKNLNKTLSFFDRYFCLKIEHMQTLSEDSQNWLEQNDHLKFAEYFIDLAIHKKDRKWRIAAIDIASQWCKLYEAGADGKDLHPTIRTLIQLRRNSFFMQFVQTDSILKSSCIRRQKRIHGVNMRIRLEQYYCPSRIPDSAPPTTHPSTAEYFSR